MGQRKQYDKEYKTEVVKLVIETGKSAASVARELGLAKCTVSNWVKQYNQYQKSAFPGKGKGYDQEVRNLKNKIADLEEENAILKKAAAIFVRGPK